MSDWEEETNVTEAAALATPAQSERDRAYLIVLAGANVGEMYKLAGAEAIIGRGRRADVRVLDDGVSRQHARIGVSGDDLWVEDLGSRNGTFCNGEPIIGRLTLSDGDKIQVGRTTILKFTFHDSLDESFQRQMYDSALRDGLTKVFNKRYFTDRLESEFRFAQRHNEALSLLLLDLDLFKLVNDTHGHLGGDHVLQQFAAAMQRSVRNEDVLARYGGEEFAVISRSIDGPHAVQFGERLRRIVEDLKIEFDGQPIHVTVSIGVAAIPEVDATDPIQLIQAADRALYWAKSKGRNRVDQFKAGMQDEDTRPT